MVDSTHSRVFRRAMLAAPIAGLLAVAPLAAPASAAPAETVCASVGAGGAEGDGDSGYNPDWTPHWGKPVVSGNGRFVAFTSAASTLVPGDTNQSSDIFVRDLRRGTTQRVSVGAAGAQGDGPSQEPSISADGRYVAFTSMASNLVADDENGSYDVFVHDRSTGTTTLLHRDSSGDQGNAAAWTPAISADGRHIAFASSSVNLAPGNPSGHYAIYARDIEAGRTELVSAAPDGTWPDAVAEAPAISADGRYVAYSSPATNIVPDDTDENYDIFVHDRRTGTTTSASPGSSGGHGAPSISADGRYIAFHTGYPDYTPTTVSVHDRRRGVTRVLTGQADAESRDPSISADGRSIVFESAATNLVAGDTNGVADIFRYDVRSGTTTRMSTATTGEQADGTSRAASISGNGRVVVYGSAATNLVAGDTNARVDVFAHRP
ncbi:TolB family protein [Spirillospora sp. CA-255316]